MLRNQLEVGLRYLNEGEYEIAEIAFQQALKMDSASVEAAEGLALAQKRGRKQAPQKVTPLDTSWATRVPVATSKPPPPPPPPPLDPQVAATRLRDLGGVSRALACEIRASELRGELEAKRQEWREEIRLRSRRTPNHPHLFFYNLTNSGASAIDPILRQLLHEDYFYETLGTPVDTDWLQPFLDGPVPFYHWTHSGPRALEKWLHRDDVKFVCLYRDPRDVLVSHARDPLNRVGWASLTTAQVVARLAEGSEGEFADLFADANAWLAKEPSRVLRFRFEDMKQDIPATVRAILNYIGLPINEERLQFLCEAHSFQRQTGRDRGQEGPTVRTAYMVRKGIAGDWRNHFDVAAADRFRRHCGHYLIEWGYEKDHEWVEELKGPLAKPA
ncbi:MAG: sulfotransferase domain-containing protein [Verrucomicrobiales bacterium]|nr:sulfotransferase domain-containing protein [Verrucomicrobiales bacterium]